MEFKEDTDVNEHVKAIVDNNMAEFEFYVLACAVKHREFFRGVAGKLCEDLEGECIGDFSEDAHNLTFYMLTIYLQMLGLNAPIPMKNVLNMVMQNCIQKGEVLIPGEDDVVSDMFYKCVEYDTDQCLDIAREGFYYWLQKKRTIYLLEKYGRTKSSSQIANILQKETSHLHAIKPEAHLKTFGMGVRDKELDVRRLKTGFHKLDAAMGGGPGMGEFCLAISVQGGGKTVLACQMASSMSLNGAKGVLISTEQRHDELEPRIIACHANIPFDKIKDKVDLDTLLPEEVARYEDLEKKLTGNFLIANWGDKISNTVVADLTEEIDRCANMMGGLDYVVLDWLGGRLGAGGKDPAAKRQLYQEAADCMGNTARTMRVATIGMAQANMKQAANRKSIDSTHLAENKQLGATASTIVGISSLLAGEEEGAPIFSPEQFLYLSKARKSVGGHVPIKRAFSYQKFTSR